MRSTLVVIVLSVALIVGVLGWVKNSGAADTLHQIADSKSITNPLDASMQEFDKTLQKIEQGV